MNSKPLHQITNMSSFCSSSFVQQHMASTAFCLNTNTNQASFCWGLWPNVAGPSSLRWSSSRLVLFYVAKANLPWKRPSRQQQIELWRYDVACRIDALCYLIFVFLINYDILLSYHHFIGLIFSLYIFIIMLAYFYSFIKKYKFSLVYILSNLFKYSKSHWYNHIASVGY